MHILLACWPPSWTLPPLDPTQRQVAPAANERGDEMNRASSAACTRCLHFHHDTAACNKPQAACTLCHSTNHAVPRCPQFRVQHIAVDEAYIQHQLRVARVTPTATVPPPIYTSVTYPSLPSSSPASSWAGRVIGCTSPSSTATSIPSPNSPTASTASPSTSSPASSPTTSLCAGVQSMGVDSAAFQSMAASMASLLAELTEMRNQLNELRALLAEKDKEIHALRAERNMGESKRKTNGGDSIISPPSSTVRLMLRMLGSDPGTAATTTTTG